MPHVDRPDGARIHYEVHGSGFPLLLFAPGGVNSQIPIWTMSQVNPLEFADEFMVIGMNQRNATGSPGPLKAPTWEEHSADQRAVLEALGITRTLLYGGCIGVSYVLRFIHDAPPGMVAAGAGQDPAGLVEGVNSRNTYSAMFDPTIATAREGGMQAVIEAALADPIFVRNNAGGPFAARIARDAAFRDEILALSPARYEQLLRDYDAQIFGYETPYLCVEESFVRSCPVPLFIIPGNDVFHPYGISERMCRQAPQIECLDADCRSPEKLPDTIRRLRGFLRAHAR